ncbi:COG0863 DNA modification methylase [uncultured Caudovirales phage]|uniref:COG0863 DNA modification methylase n=1 Tax=uncultured Caudovirales phage TaxID=2100421 RepID=A0A6J5MZM7_9CAUD|nr:COG0863 DNA modification methylase [uncultured Caudovirales phage]
MTENQWPADNVTRRKVSALVPYARNSRTHSKEQIDQIAASIKEWGFTTPILADTDGQIIAGHGRLLAAQKLGLDEVPTMTAEGWTDAQKKAYVIADNKLALNAGWDNAMLAIEMQELGDMGFDLDLTGFGKDELSALFPQENTGLTDEDAVPEVPVVPVTVEGDVWLLGRHRLMCGDSTSADSVTKLMAGQKPNTMVTDPPYGVKLDQSWRDKALGSKAMGKGNAHLVENDDKADWTEVWALFEGNVAYVWHASTFTDVVMQSLRNVGLEPSQQIIWNKSVMVMGRSDYHFKHEPCWYAIRKGQTHNWKGDRKQTTIWDAAPPNHIMGGSKEERTSHPTQKPAILYEKAYLNHTNPG